MTFLIFDTETCGLPRSWKVDPTEDFDNWPRMVQLAWQLHDQTGALLHCDSLTVKPVDFEIPLSATKIHGIAHEDALAHGVPIADVLKSFVEQLEKADFMVGHNLKGFDLNILKAEFLRGQLEIKPLDRPAIDTMKDTLDQKQPPGKGAGRPKFKKLAELYEDLFGEPTVRDHDAGGDVHSTARSFFESVKRGLLEMPVSIDADNIRYEAPDLSALRRDEPTAPLPARSTGERESEDPSTATPPRSQPASGKTPPADGSDPASDDSGSGEESSESDPEPQPAEKGEPYCHLHVHSYYSILQATPSVGDLVEAAANDGMQALALTDLGNMYGSFEFNQMALEKGIKPILGCEFYVARERKRLKFTLEDPDVVFRQVLLAKSREGFNNLCSLNACGFREGHYHGRPRIDKDLIADHREGTMALIAGVDSQVPFLMYHKGKVEAEEALKWWKELYGPDLYIAISNYGIETQRPVREWLMQMADKHCIKMVASSEVYFLKPENAYLHDILLCIKENKKITDPVGDTRSTRKSLESKEYYFKSQSEIRALFADHPEMISNTWEVAQKVEAYSLKSEVRLPFFEIPEKFGSAGSEQTAPESEESDPENAYLRHITYEGAAKKYPEITPEIRKRLDFELDTIRDTGYPGYFLIIEDLIRKSRDMGVIVGPGRGSVSGSMVAYCLDITRVNPLEYNLLFERFLDPDRVTLPDIDIDFDNKGREEVLKYVAEKYGKNQVAQIVTFNVLGPRSSIRDAGRVLGIALNDVDRLASLVPERPGITFAKALEETSKLKKILEGEAAESKVLRLAMSLEGIVRNAGVHACGIIISPEDLTKCIPTAVSQDSDLMVTQYDNHFVEAAGLLKMDFLGLKTLSILHQATQDIQARLGKEIDIDSVPLDDTPTYKLFQEGSTVATFQFESSGMRLFLKQLKPDKFEDLIAMNALYRPGPMEHIPAFINRKRGHEKIVFDVAQMEEILSETYGITVYQEQVMLLSQELAGFTKGEADQLRKAMGKKEEATLLAMKPKFIEGAAARGHSSEVVRKIWKEWETFASYAFNKSHSTCYALLAYQTAYLKANFPEDYMAAVLTMNQGNIDKIRGILEECKAMGIAVLGPDINASLSEFSVTEPGTIRFGLGSIKGVGREMMNAMIEERRKGGGFVNLLDFSWRADLKLMGKRGLESLAMAGAFDGFKPYHRKQFVETPKGKASLVEQILAQHKKKNEESKYAQPNLSTADYEKIIPPPEEVTPFTEVEKIRIEKEITGQYISGHPLDQYEWELRAFPGVKTLTDLASMEDFKGKPALIPAVVSSLETRKSKKGNEFGIAIFEDHQTTWKQFFFQGSLSLFRKIREGEAYLLEGAPKDHWSGKGDLEFELRYVYPLREIKNNSSFELRLKIPLESLDDELTGNLEKFVKENPGSQDLRMVVKDTENEDLPPLEMTRQGCVAASAPGSEAFQAIDKHVTLEKMSLNKEKLKTLAVGR